MRKKLDYEDTEIDVKFTVDAFKQDIIKDSLSLTILCKEGKYEAIFYGPYVIPSSTEMAAIFGYLFGNKTARLVSSVFSGKDRIFIDDVHYDVPVLIECALIEFGDWVFDKGEN